MSEIATQEERPGVIAEIRSEAFKEQLAQALPEGVTPDRFARIAVTALLENQRLLNADRQSLFQALLKCAADGLMPDGRQAALVQRGDKVAYQPMVLGLRIYAARFGWTIRSAAVREHDLFEFTDEPPALTHRIARDGDRGDLTFAYAVARHIDGRREQRVMTRGEVLKRAESATTKNVWEKWPDEMWAKTPARDLFQELPLAHQPGSRIEQALVDAEALEPGEAAAMLYPSDDSALTHGVESPAAAHTPAAAEAQPSGAASTLQPEAAPAPPDDEPGPSAAAPTPEERAKALADEAAKFVPPTGKYASGGQHGPKSLGEILASGDDGERWLKWALGKVSEPPVYAGAVQAFARVFAPALWQEAEARKGLA